MAPWPHPNDVPHLVLVVRQDAVKVFRMPEQLIWSHREAVLPQLPLELRAKHLKRSFRPFGGNNPHPCGQDVVPPSATCKPPSRFQGAILRGPASTTLHMQGKA